MGWSWFRGVLFVIFGCYASCSPSASAAMLMTPTLTVSSSAKNGGFSTLLQLQRLIPTTIRASTSPTTTARPFQNVTTINHSLAPRFPWAAVSCRLNLPQRSRRRMLSYDSQVQATSDFRLDDQQASEDQPLPLTRTVVRRMKVDQLRDALYQRGLDTRGKRHDLMNRVLQWLEDNVQNGFQDEGANYQQNDRGQRQELALLDPEATYIVKTRVEHARGKVEGFGLGMILQDGNSRQILRSHQMLVPVPQGKVFGAGLSCINRAMRYARECGVEEIILECDDIGIVYQLCGQPRTFGREKLRALYMEAFELKNSFRSFEIRRTVKDRGNVSEVELLARTVLAKQKSMTPSDVWETHNDDDLTPANPPKDSRMERDRISVDPARQYLLQFDGGSRENPVGCAGAGMVIYDDTGNEIWCGWKYLGKGSTNNIAEYNALIEGLQVARTLGIRHVRAQGDSNLVVQQIIGQFKVRKDSLVPLWRKAKKLAQEFDSFEIEHLPRSENKRADYLANSAMDLRDSNMSLASEEGT